MLHRTSDRRRQPWQLLAVALYALFLVVAPFEHHDLWCEAKTPQHCTSCVSSQLGSDPHAAPAPAVSHLADAGRAEAPQSLFLGVLVVSGTSGRSPPTAL